MDEIESLTGRLYRSNSGSGGPTGTVKVVGDGGGDRVWVENEQAPANRRQILRRRLLSKRAYKLVGSLNGASATPDVPLREPPTFNGPAFAAKLRNWMQIEGLTVDELAERGGIHPSTVANLRRGTPGAGKKRAHQEVINPAINSLACIAHGLSVELSYVLAWAGLGDGDRWDNFSDSERMGIALRLEADTDDPADLDAAVADLRKEL